MMEHALNYAKRGFPVFPIYEPTAIGVCSCSHGADVMVGTNKHSIGKHPRTENGVLDATTDEATIRRWWTKWPNASIGMRTGMASGVFVVDLDGPEGLQSGRKLNLTSPIRSITGNGEQLCYLSPEGGAKNSVKKLAPGLDTRGENGYIVVPPSLHPNGKRYSWAGSVISRDLLPVLPSLFLEPSRPSTLRRGNDTRWISEALEEMRKGHVHNTLIPVLGKFRHHNFSEEDTFNLLQPHALVDGKPFEGLRDKIAEIWRRYEPKSDPALENRKVESIEQFLEQIQEPEWICKPVIAKKSIGFVIGLPETLKTWLCIDLAVECARESGLWLGLFPVTNCKVLFIDQERWKGETQRRFGAVITAKGLTQAELKGNLYIKSGTAIRLNIDASYQAFRTELLEMRPDLVIVDSFATFHTAQENNRTEIQAVLEAIKTLRNEIGCTFAFINHENKHAYPNGEPQGAPNLGTMAGSIGIGAAAEFALTVRKVEEGSSLVWPTKATLSKAVSPFYVTIRDVDNGIVIRGMDEQAD